MALYENNILDQVKFLCCNALRPHERPPAFPGERGLESGLKTLPEDRLGRSPLREKSFNFRPLRGASRAANPGAFDPRDGCSEAQCIRFTAALREREREATMQGIAGTERIDRPNGEHGHAADRALLEIKNIRWAVADGEERVGVVSYPVKPLAEIATAGGRFQTFGREHDVSGDPKQRIVFFRRFITIKNH